jgi:hypothetical protein
MHQHALGGLFHLGHRVGFQTQLFSDKGLYEHLATRFCPVNSIVALPLRKSAILSGVSVSIFSMRICIHLAAWQALNFRIILYWTILVSGPNTPSGTLIDRAQNH